MSQTDKQNKNGRSGLFFRIGLAIIGLAAIVVIVILTVKFQSAASSAPIADLNDSTLPAEQIPSTTPTSYQDELQKPETTSITNPAINTFELKKDAELCQEGGKPIIYLFSASYCPHSKWISETFDAIAGKYAKQGKIKAYHWDVDTGDDLLTKAVEKNLPPAAEKAYADFSPDSAIPAFVFGCEYFRIGNGYENEGQDGLANEAKEFEAVLGELTDNKIKK